MIMDMVVTEVEAAETTEEVAAAVIEEAAVVVAVVVVVAEDVNQQLKRKFHCYRITI